MAIIAIVIILVASFSIYFGLTYPRTSANIPVSFTAGIDSKTESFSQMFLNDKVQVQVTVQSGAALWRAQILSDDKVIWTHTAAQSEQQSFSSGWIPLPSGNYNFTFGTIGVSSLDATASVTSKGGVW